MEEFKMILTFAASLKTSTDALRKEAIASFTKNKPPLSREEAEKIVSDHEKIIVTASKIDMLTMTKETQQLLIDTINLLAPGVMRTPAMAVYLHRFANVHRINKDKTELLLTISYPNLEGVNATKKHYYFTPEGQERLSKIKIPPKFLEREFTEIKDSVEKLDTRISTLTDLNKMIAVNKKLLLENTEKNRSQTGLEISEYNAIYKNFINQCQQVLSSYQMEFELIKLKLLTMRRSVDVDDTRSSESLDDIEMKYQELFQSFPDLRQPLDIEIAKALSINELRQEITNAFKNSNDAILNEIDAHFDQLSGMLDPSIISSNVQEKIINIKNTLNNYSEHSPYIKEFIERNMSVLAEKIEFFLKIPFPKLNELDIAQGIKAIEDKEKRENTSQKQNMSQKTVPELEVIRRKTQYLESKIGEIQENLQKASKLLNYDSAHPISVADKLEMLQQLKNECETAMSYYKKELATTRSSLNMVLQKINATTPKSESGKQGNQYLERITSLFKKTEAIERVISPQVLTPSRHMQENISPRKQSGAPSH